MNNLKYNLATPLRHFKIRLEDGRTTLKENKILSDLTIQNKAEFNISSTVSGAVSEANITIYGITVDKMAYLSTSCTNWQKNVIENKVYLEAGYSNKNALIFTGTVVEAIPSFDNANYNIALKCLSSFPEMLNTVKNYSFKGETNLIDILNKINNDLRFTLVNNLEDDYILGGYVFQQTSIIEHIRNLAKITGLNIYVNNNRLILTEISKPVKQFKEYIIDQKNLIGSVKPTNLGCDCSVRLDSAIQTGQKVKISSLKFPQLQKNTYVVQTIGHEGDTRGSTWKTNLTMIREGIYND